MASSYLRSISIPSKREILCPVRSGASYRNAQSPPVSMGIGALVSMSMLRIGCFSPMSDSVFELKMRGRYNSGGFMAVFNVAALRTLDQFKKEISDPHIV